MIRFAAVLGLAACVMATASRLDAAENARPNILFIMVDDIGFSDPGCFGGEILTPHLDSLAAGGLRLTQFYNTGRCCPTRGAVMTGQYPHRVGLGHMVKDLGQKGYRGRLSDDAVTIAQLLQHAGYRTFMSGKWHCGTPDPTQHGFEQFYGTLISAQTFWDADHFTRLPADAPRRQYAAGQFYGTDALTDHALDFLDEARTTPDRPWFLYLAYNAPHFPLQAPATDIARYANVYTIGWDAIREHRLARMKSLGIVPADTALTPRSPYWGWQKGDPVENPAWDSLPADRRADLARRMAVYAAMVDRIDQNLGRILAALRQRGELENTLIVFTSDNGACGEWDPFGFDGRSGPDNILHRGEQLARMGQAGTYHSVGSGWANASNTPWRLYKHFNHEGGIASPGVVHWPAGLADTSPGSILAQPVHIIDLLPTFLDAAGAEIPAKLNGQSVMPPAGVSLLPMLRGAEPSERPLFFEHQGNRAVRLGKWKLSAVRNQPWELYDLSRDRVEMQDLAARHPDIVAQLADLWQAWAEENNVLPFPKDYQVGYLP